LVKFEHFTIANQIMTRTSTGSITPVRYTQCLGYGAYSRMPPVSSTLAAFSAKYYSREQWICRQQYCCC